MFINFKLYLDTEIARPGMKEAEEIPWPEDASLLRDEFHFFREHCTSGILGKDKKGTNRAMASVEIFIETSG